MTFDHYTLRPFTQKNLSELILFNVYICFCKEGNREVTPVEVVDFKRPTVLERGYVVVNLSFYGNHLHNKERVYIWDENILRDDDNIPIGRFYIQDAAKYPGVLYHGSKNYDLEVDLDFNRCLYLTNKKDIAKDFALSKDCGGVLSGEVPCIHHFSVCWKNPLIITNEEDWFRVGDITAVNKYKILNDGYDGLVYCDETNPGVVYYVVFKYINLDDLFKVEKVI